MSRPQPALAADFSQLPDRDFNRIVLPGSAIERGPGSPGSPGSWRFANEPTGSTRYTNAQIDDTGGRARGDFLWRPPLTLTVTARFSRQAGDLRGTAGFGFWNDPFMMSGWRMPSLPRAVWFFYASPPSDLRLDLDTPGSGWKAATLDAIRWPFFALAPLAPVAIPLMNIPALYRRLWPIGQRAIGVSEAAIDAAMTDWHDYRLEWGTDRAVFRVDDQIALDCASPPRGPLGFVMWIDNQGMVATPQGRFRWFTLPLSEKQWMEVAELRIEGRS